jgi:hypothetical protein
MKKRHKRQLDTRIILQHDNDKILKQKALEIYLRDNKENKG